MTISSVASGKRLFTYLLIIGAVSALAACGGSGGKKKSSSSSVSSTMTASSSVSSSSVAPDTRSEPFSFTSQADAEREQQVYSNTVTIAGIDAPTNISIEGNGYYAVGDGENWVAIDSEVNNGDQVRLRVQAKSGFSEIETITLTVGDQSAEFSVTTLARDVEPDAFTFVDISDAELDSVVDSNEIIIQGVNAKTPVSVVGGQYAINGKSFVESGSEGVVAGDRVKVQGSAPGAFSASQEVVLTVGGVSDTFTISTPVDDEAPTVELYFPTAKGLTAATTLTVRGVATDSMSPITSVVVNGVEATVTGEKAVTWLAEITLTAAGDTDIVVTATDDAGNASEAVVLSTITQQSDLTISYNVTGREGNRYYSAEFFDDYSKLFITENEGDYLFVNPQTGEMSVVWANEDVANNGRTFGAVGYKFGNNEGVFVGVDSAIYDVDFSRKTRELVSNASYENSSLDFARIKYLDVYAGATIGDSFIVVADASSLELIKVDIQDGQKTLLSSLDVDALGPKWGSITGVVVDAVENMAYVGSFGSIHAVDLQNEMRSIVVADSDIEEDPKTPSKHIVYDEGVLVGYSSRPDNVLPISKVGTDGVGMKELVTDNNAVMGSINGFSVFSLRQLGYTTYTRGIGIADLETGEQVILFKVAN